MSSTIVECKGGHAIVGHWMDLITALLYSGVSDNPNSKEVTT